MGRLFEFSVLNCTFMVSFRTTSYEHDSDSETVRAKPKQLAALMTGEMHKHHKTKNIKITTQHLEITKIKFHLYSDDVRF